MVQVVQEGGELPVWEVVMAVELNTSEAVVLVLSKDIAVAPLRMGFAGVGQRLRADAVDDAVETFIVGASRGVGRSDSRRDGSSAVVAVIVNERSAQGSAIAEDCAGMLTKKGRAKGLAEDVAPLCSGGYPAKAEELDS